MAAKKKMPIPHLKLRKDNKKQSPYPIYLWLTIDRKSFRKHTGVFVDEKCWDKNRQRLKRSAPNFEEHNMILTRLIGQANEVLIDLRLRQIPISKETFEKAFRQPEGGEDFLVYWEVKMYELAQRGLIGDATLVHHKRHLNQLRSFLLKDHSKKELRFFEINPSLMAQFDLWLAKEMKRKGHDGRGERWNCQKAVKRYLNFAKTDKKEFENPYPSGTKVKPAPTHPIYLLDIELQKMFQLFYSDNYLITQTMRIVLRSFLVQCFSGMRFSEVKSAKIEYRRSDRLIIPPLNTETKGITTREIPLSVPLRKLLRGNLVNEDRKFCKRKYKLEYEPLCPTISEPKTNQYLKRLAKMAYVNQPKISTHVGRHTFATLFLEKGGSLEVLKELLGHKKLKSTMVYVHITNQRKKDQVFDAFNEFGNE